ncbi:MAG: oxidoreductase [Deltaproteobacteria bacterium]|nr:oxidoreductase [Deltaproteobacteria bacterium]
MIRCLITPLEACEVWADLRPELGDAIEPVCTQGLVDDPVRLAGLLAQVDAAILGVERVNDAVLSDARRLKVISRFGVGVDAIDCEALRRRGIRLANTPGAMRDAVARLALTFALAMSYHLPAHAAAFARGAWRRIPNRAPEETTIGVIGMGATGTAFAALARAVGFRVLGYRRSRAEETTIPMAADLGAVVDAADLLSLHLPLTAETQGIVNAAFLARCRGKGLINTARGGLVDETALLAALDAGTLLYYATDVFAREPAEGLSLTLARHPAVLATPHVAAMDRVTARAMLRRAAMNALACVRGDHAAVHAYVV